MEELPLPRILEKYKNGSHTRLLLGIAIEERHECGYHVKPCSKLVYTFSDTNGRQFAPTRWCSLAIEANGYKPTGEYAELSSLCRCERYFTHLYVLRLEDEKWYVGITSRPGKRLEEHKTLLAAKWTQKYKMVELQTIEMFSQPLPECEAVVRENQKVQELCAQYGASNVRGGDWNG